MNADFVRALVSAAQTKHQINQLTESMSTEWQDKVIAARGCLAVQAVIAEFTADNKAVLDDE